MSIIKRDSFCGKLRKKDIKKVVKLNGWIKKMRDFGKIVFVDLWDHTGICQLVFDINIKNHKEIKNCIVGDVIGVEGKVVKRQEKNDDIDTGMIEIQVEKLKKYSSSDPLPIDRSKEISEENRLKYRYLDLRTNKMQKNLRLRHNFNTAIREFLNKQNFIEVETPILSKSTPEGARDYVVPSRIKKGKFYALPQSPQLFKQLLMVGGFDKYYQFARCFRDEDLRANRQPEFTQVDIEMSFVDEEDVQNLTENLIKFSFEKILKDNIDLPFKKMSYKEAIDKYGTDKPDLRFDMIIKDLTEKIKVKGFKVFENIVSSNKKIKAIKLNEIVSRSQIDDYIEFVKKFDAKGLVWFKKQNDKLSSSVKKFFDDKGKSIEKEMDIKNGETVFIVADKESVVSESLGRLRIKLRDDYDLVKDKNALKFSWITHFPMFEYSETEKRYKAAHHPFTMPYKEDIKKYKNQPKKIRSFGYDLVLNGEEIAGGSIRNHISSIQEDIFDILNISKEEQDERFGFFIDALKYGTPPHGGIAFGLGRIIQILAQVDSFRDVIAFPKTTNAACLMTGSPSSINKEQIKELGLEVKKD